jgi:hypothetical protein
MKENMQKTTVIVEKNTLKSLKKIAIDKDLTQNELMNKYIKAGILKDKESAKY